MVLYFVHYDNDNYICTSLAEGYEPIIIDTNDIYDVYSIEGVFKLNATLYNSKENILKSELQNRISEIGNVLNQNNKLIDEVSEQGKRVDTMLDILKNKLL
ncbi:MAG: hypothetical protein MJ211_15805 [Bacteroidales bacterium]|nr:hypothetical protein [Bacteroidales bacterium]